MNPPRTIPPADETAPCRTSVTGTPMTSGQAERVVPLLKALADPVRLRLVSLIAASEGGEACVCDLNEAFDQTQATISHHLKVLHSAGVLDREKRGVGVYYAVKPEALTAVADLLTAGALGGGDEAHQPQPYRVGEGLEQRCHLLGLLRGHRGAGQRGAAGQAGVVHRRLLRRGHRSPS